MTSGMPPPGNRPDDGALPFSALAALTIRRAPTFIGLCDADLQPCFLNAAARTMLGLPPAADVGRLGILDLFAPRHRDAARTVGLPRLLRDGAWEAELCLRDLTDASRETQVRWSSFVLRDEVGRLVGAAAFATDSSGGNRSDKILRDQEMLLRSVLANLPPGGGVHGDRGAPIHSHHRSGDAAWLALPPSREPPPGGRTSDAQGRLGASTANPGARANDATMGGEVFARSPSGHAAHPYRLWRPVRADDEPSEPRAGLSREASEHRQSQGHLTNNEVRLHAATELVGLGIYSWDLVTGVLEWNDQLRAMWGLPPGAFVDSDVYGRGIHPEDLSRVRRLIDACGGPKDEGSFSIEYRVNGRDGVLRHVATSGRTIFDHGRASGFIGVASDVTAQRRDEAAKHGSEAELRGFAEHSNALIWIGDPGAGEIIYRSAAFERIWGIPCDQGATSFAAWLNDVHSEDRTQVERALAAMMGGEVAHFEYRIVRPSDGTIRCLRDTGFPIRDERGEVIRIGGIAEDLTHNQERQVYVVSAGVDEARWLADLARSAGHRTRRFESASGFLDMAPVLASGCVLVDLRKAKRDDLSIPRELKARAIALPVVVIDDPDAGIASAVAAMKAGAVDYLALSDDEEFRTALTRAIAECHGATRVTTRADSAGALVARLTRREREVLVGLVEGGTNKTIALQLGISPRTVELHRAQVMNRLGATSLTRLLQIALAAGLTPTSSASDKRNTT